MILPTSNPHRTAIRAALVLAAFVSFPAIGQNGVVALQKAASTLSSEEQKLNSVQSILMADPARALESAQSAARTIAISDRKGEGPLLARAHWLQAAALFGLHRAPESLAVVDRALAAGEIDIRQPTKLLGDLYLTRGEALFEMGRVEDSVRELQRAFEIYRAANQPRSEAIALQAIGSIYLMGRDYDHGVRYYAQSAAIYNGDPALLVSAFHNRGIAWLEQGKPRLALADFNKALENAEKLKSPLLEARVLGHLASAQIAVGDLDGASQSVTKGLATASSTTSGDWVALLYRAAAELSFRRGHLEEAARLIEKTFEAVKNEKSTLMLRDFHHTAFEIYKARGENGKALQHFEQYKALDDQALAAAASTSAALAAARFDFANQNVRIAQLRIAESKREAANRLNLLIATSSAASVILVLLLIGYFQIRRSRNQVRAANTELSASNAELEQALTARTQFLATTSHEIRTPLNGILGMTQVLLADRGLAADVKGKIELVHGAGETMRALVDDILDVAKMTTGELKLHPAEMDLHRLLKDTVQVWSGQAESKGISIVVNLANCPQRIVQDEVRLRQIIFNLTANAVKFTDRGEVRVVASAVPQGDGEQLRVQISDTGIGIPPDKLEEIFESFRQVDSGTTRRHGGTGLGLAICRNLAQVMGGDIAVASVLGAGATFTLDVPLERAADLRVASVDDGPITLDKARLLLIEANPLSQSILRAVLSPKVASFSTASAAEEAAATLAEGQTDLVVMDATTMRMDLAAIESIARTLAQTGGRTVLMWPKPDDTVVDKIAGIGVSQLLATPLAAPDLVAALIALYATDDSQEVVAA